jgi:leader peptidase (prepilin peptidase)/N-methyltransferase
VSWALAAAVLGAPVGAAAERIAAAYPWTAPVVRVPVARTAVVALLAAVLFGGTVARFGSAPPLAAWLWFVAAGLLLGLVDLRHRLLPNRVLLPATAVAVGLLGAEALLQGDGTALLRAVEAGAASFGVGLVMALISPAGLGMGDVKLAGLLGLMLGWLSWSAVLLGFFLGFLLQAVVILVLLLARRAGRGTDVPFGPALLVATLVVGLLAVG